MLQLTAKQRLKGWNWGMEFVPVTAAHDPTRMIISFGHRQVLIYHMRLQLLTNVGLNALKLLNSGYYSCCTLLPLGTAAPRVPKESAQSTWRAAYGTRVARFLIRSKEETSSPFETKEKKHKETKRQTNGRFSHTLLHSVKWGKRQE